MYKEKTFLAVIPARGGSKRLPGKNILNLAGKPLIAWTIKAAMGSKYLDESIISTDDPEIAKISEQNGAKVPFIRPKKLATDTATSFFVLKHAIDYYKKMGKEFDYIVMLQPTAPLRTAVDIDSAIETLVDGGSDSIISVCKEDHHPLRSNILPDNHSMDSFLRTETKDKTIQELPIYYRLNGAIHICDLPLFLKQQTFFLNKNTVAFIMPQDKSPDIDTILDFKIAETLIKIND